MSEGLDINTLEKNVKRIVSKFPFIQKAQTLLKTTHTIKMRLDVTEECFIQIYYNIQRDNTSYVVILGGKRIYGRDCPRGNWHRHPEENPEGHDSSLEGSRKVKLEEFLLETQEILLKKEIL
ncbi:MAG TPA: hypothetical protein ACFYD6_04715 [Candidatus Brocadiia bacterium]|nr:hypothetical protein [Candidatus Brocadiales bacterium]